MVTPKEASIAEMKGVHCFSSGGDENKELQALMLLATCTHVAVSDDLHLFGHAVFMFSVSNRHLCLFMLLIVTSMLLVLCGRNSVAPPVSSGRKFASSTEDT